MANPNDVAKLLTAALEIVATTLGPEVFKQVGPLQVQRMVVSTLAEAWAEAVRAEWRAAAVQSPDIAGAMAIADEMMRADGYTMADPIVLPPGFRLKQARVGQHGAEMACLDHSMASATPLSAVYTSVVMATLDAVEIVQAKKQESEVGPATDSGQGEENGGSSSDEGLQSQSDRKDGTS